MTAEQLDEYWTPKELRAFVKLPEKKHDRTWYRLRPFFATALVQFPGPVNHRLYHAAQVRALLEGRRSRLSPLSRKRSLRAAPGLESAPPAPHVEKRSLLRRMA